MNGVAGMLESRNTPLCKGYETDRIALGSIIVGGFTTEPQNTQSYTESLRHLGQPIMVLSGYTKNR